MLRDVPPNVHNAFLSSLDARAQLREEPWRIGFGVREADLGVAE